MDLFEQESNEFSTRHIGPDPVETTEMLSAIGVDSLDALINKTIPIGIRISEDALMPIGDAMSEFEYLQFLAQIAKKIRCINPTSARDIMVLLFLL